MRKRRKKIWFPFISLSLWIMGSFYQSVYAAPNQGNDEKVRTDVIGEEYVHPLKEMEIKLPLNLENKGSSGYDPVLTLTFGDMYGLSFISEEGEEVSKGEDIKIKISKAASKNGEIIKRMKMDLNDLDIGNYNDEIAGKTIAVDVILTVKEEEKTEEGTKIRTVNIDLDDFLIYLLPIPKIQ